MSDQRPAPEDESAQGTTHFGFRTVDAAAKAGLVREVFDTVAPNYDLMNDLMSAGIHRLWKRTLIDAVSPRANERFIDVAGGTGDIAFRLKERAGEAHRTPIAVCDINAEMLTVGRNRALDRGIVEGLVWVSGDAQRLPFPDMSFDAYTVAFGLRNVTDIDAALREARRVLKPGGRFFCLEFSRVAVPALERLYDAYSFTVLPWLGAIVAGDRDAYRYLAESIRRFPDQTSLAKRLSGAGLAQVRYRNMSGGIVALHSGWRV